MADGSCTARSHRRTERGADPEGLEGAASGKGGAASSALGHLECSLTPLSRPPGFLRLRSLPSPLPEPPQAPADPASPRRVWPGTPQQPPRGSLAWSLPSLS